MGQITIEDFRQGTAKLCPRIYALRDAAFDEIERRMFGKGEYPILLRSSPFSPLETKEYGPGKSNSSVVLDVLRTAATDSARQPAHYDAWALAWLGGEERPGSEKRDVWIYARVYERGLVRSFEFGQQVETSFLYSIRSRLKRIGAPTLLSMHAPPMDPDREPELPHEATLEQLIVGLRVRSNHSEARRRLVAAGPEADATLERVVRQDSCELIRHLVECVIQSRELDRDPAAGDRQANLSSSAAFETHHAVGEFWFFLSTATSLPTSARRRIREASEARTQRGLDLKESAGDLRLQAYISEVRAAAPGLLRDRDMEGWQLALLRAQREDQELCTTLASAWRRERLYSEETPDSKGNLYETLTCYADASRGRITFENVHTRFVDESEEPSDDDGVPGLACFRMNGAEVEVPIRFRDDTEAVHRTINASLETHGINERFFCLPSADDSVRVLFEKPAAIEEMRRRGLIPSREPSLWCRKQLRLIDRIHIADGEVGDAVCDERGVTLSTFQGPLVRLEGESFHRVWSHGSALYQPRFIFDDVTVGETMRGASIALSAQGHVLWTSKGRPISSDGALVLSSQNDAIEALDGLTGDPIWKTTVPERVTATIAGKHALVLAGDTLRVLALANGKTQWEGKPFESDKGDRRSMLSRRGEVLVSTDEELSVLDISEKGVTVRWTTRAKEGTTTAAVLDGCVFFRDVEPFLVCKDLKTGREVWHQAAPENVHHLVTWGQFLVVSAGSGLSLFERFTGEHVSTYSAEPGLGSAMVFRDRLIVPGLAFLNVFDYC